MLEREELVLNPQYSVSGVTVSININSLKAERTGEYLSKEELFFDINAKLEEQKKGNNNVTLAFDLTISTKPNVVKYNTTGSVMLVGKADDIKKKLEVNPKTQIPQILFTIYQHLYSSIYVLSSNLNTPCPPPDLLHPMAEKIKILSCEPTENPPMVENAPQPPSTSPTVSQEPAKTTAEKTPAT